MAMAVHELRTPLSAIMGYCELLQITAAAQSLPAVSSDVAKIQQASQHMLNIIHSLLAAAKLESNEVVLVQEKVSMPNMMREVETILKPLILAKKNQLIICCDESIQFIQTQVTPLKQCLINLLSNANQFTRNGMITATVSREKEKIMFEVRDTGMGMSAAQMEKLFEPFYSTREQGVGLGLYISKKIAEKLGGTLSVKSQLKKGSIVTLTLHACYGDEPMQVS